MTVMTGSIRSHFPFAREYQRGKSFSVSQRLAKDL
jgi:hypothetical protein